MIYSEKVLSTLWRGQPVDNDLVVLYVPREGFFPTSYTVMIDGKRCRRSTKLYNCWTNMSQRCLDGSQQQQKIKSYVGCTSNFKSYQEFAEFCYNLPNFTCLDGKGNPYEIDKDVKEIADLILRAYLDLTIKLYTGNMYGENPLVMALNSICNDKPFNLKDPNSEVLSSIKSDEVILQAIGKIVTLMLTSNQFICTDVSHNSYTEEDDLD